MRDAVEKNPDIATRVSQYELAFRMQMSVPELVDISNEPKHVLDLYGVSGSDGSFGYNCLLARRLAERGVRFIHLYHRDWDFHSGLKQHLAELCESADKASAGLITDLKQRGMLDDTLVVWGGEFGRTIYSQGGLSMQNYGRDHHPRCYTMWMAGGGFKGGTIYGETDDFSYNIVKDPVHVRDFHATVLHQLGFDHERFTFKFQGLDQKLTGVLPARVVHELLA
jgi:hypothetical protein